MSLLKVARHFHKKIAQTVSETYKNMVELSNLLKAVAIDPYAVKSAGFMAVAKGLASASASMADKVFRQGVSASEMKLFMGKLNDGLTKLMLEPGLDAMDAKELSSVKSKLNQILPIDVPAMSPVKPTQTDVSKYLMDRDQVDPSLNYTPSPQMWDEQPAKIDSHQKTKLEKVVEELMNKEEAPDIMRVVPGGPNEALKTI